MLAGFRKDPATSEHADSLLSGLETVLNEEEAALANLEHLITEKRLVLMDSEARNLLEVLPRIEEVLARIGQLETIRHSLSARLGSGVDGSSGIGVEMALGAGDPTTPARFLAIRHRILGTIARIAQCNAANASLLTGLTRISKSTIDRFSQIQGASAFGPVPASKDGRTWRKAAAFDAQA